MYSPYLDAAILLFIFATIWFGIALLKKDNSLADIAWGLGFVLVTWWVHFSFGNPLLLSVMVTFWGLRLTLHIGYRNLATGEDWRYQKWRREWGRWFFVRSYLQVFLLQGFLLWVIALPLMQVDAGTGEWSYMQVFGFAIWAVGFYWEALADWQLARFKKDKNNKGKVMTSGLWRFSRHPNYFGEIVLWWGIFLFVLPYGKWYVILFSPLAITWLLTKVSGVPMLEEKYKHNKAYQQYLRETNALLPDLRKLKP